MKLLKQSTLNAYSRQRCTGALLRYLDRLSDRVAEHSGKNEPLRIDSAYGKVFKYDEQADCYLFECSADDRHRLRELITAYTRIVSVILELENA